MLEPQKTKAKIPNLMLIVPTLAFDKINIDSDMVKDFMIDI